MTRLRETRWTSAARRRFAELGRHPGHDGPTVCACDECVMAGLLDAALTEAEYEAARVASLEQALAEASERRAEVVAVLVEKLREEDGCAGFADGEACGECWNCRAWNVLTNDEARAALASVSVPEPASEEEA